MFLETFNTVIGFLISNLSASILKVLVFTISPKEITFCPFLSTIFPFKIAVELLLSLLLKLFKFFFFLIEFQDY